MSACVYGWRHCKLTGERIMAFTTSLSFCLRALIAFALLTPACLTTSSMSFSSRSPGSSSPSSSASASASLGASSPPTSRPAPGALNCSTAGGSLCREVLDLGLAEHHIGGRGFRVVGRGLEHIRLLDHEENILALLHSHADDSWDRLHAKLGHGLPG